MEQPSDPFSVENMIFNAIVESLQEVRVGFVVSASQNGSRLPGTLPFSRLSLCLNLVKVECGNEKTIARLQVLDVFGIDQFNVRVEIEVWVEHVHRRLVHTQLSLFDCVRNVGVEELEVVACVHLLLVDMGHQTDVSKAINDAQELVCALIVRSLN